MTEPSPFAELIAGAEALGYTREQINAMTVRDVIKLATEIKQAALAELEMEMEMERRRPGSFL